MIKFTKSPVQTKAVFMERTIIVSNRLPVEIRIEAGKLEAHNSVGGLATGLQSVHQPGKSLWIGWSGATREQLDSQLEQQVNEAVDQQHCVDVRLTDKEVENYYLGFSNKALWPLFHYFMEYAEFAPEQWEAYKLVNQKFADAILENYRDGEVIWVHDYQLLLVPKLIRDKRPDAIIGFFLHIPFPSFEIFRTFPWREELLSGMLGSSLIGFHTYDYERHFLSSVRRILNLEVRFNEITSYDRIIKVDSYPMGIDYEKFHSTALTHRQQGKGISEIQRKLNEFTSSGPGVKFILSIDRLDYTKGIPLRIRAFEYFLEKYPEYIEKVRLLMLAVPSRSNVPQYQKLKSETDELVGRINGRFSTVNWTPIWYFYRAMPFDDLIDLYSASDIALISPIRDGMNLVAKEYVATRTNQDGVLILSEMAGAAKEMTEALLINPNNFEQVADTLKMALEMPEEEQKSRMQILQSRLRPQTVDKWAAEFLEALQQTKNYAQISSAQKWNGELQTEMGASFAKAEKRLLLLDYDGTLVGFRNNPKDAHPDAELLTLLDDIANNGNTDVVIISGRDRQTIQQWFSEKPYTLITDHGVWLRRKDADWEMLELLKNDWKENIRPVLQRYTSRTPGTFIEEKEFSLAWHYRKADAELAQMRVMEATTMLNSLISNNALSVLEGSKVLEIKSSSVNKGRAAARLVAGSDYDFIFAIGDDWTDEYLFEELPHDAYTIKVGFKKTRARFFVSNSDAVRQLLKAFAKTHG